MIVRHPCLVNSLLADETPGGISKRNQPIHFASQYTPLFSKGKDLTNHEGLQICYQALFAARYRLSTRKNLVRSIENRHSELDRQSDFVRIPGVVEGMHRNVRTLVRHRRGRSTKEFPNSRLQGPDLLG